MATSQMPHNSVIAALDIGKQSRMGAITFLAYDYFLTLDLESTLIWPRRRIISFVYFFSRFFALIYLIFDSIPLTPSGVVSSKICVIYLMCDDIVTLATTITVQAILQLRIYALYDKSRSILVFLLISSAAEIAVMVVLVAVTISHIEHLPVISTPTGCEYTGILKVSALFWIPGLVFEPIILVLALFKARPYHLMTNSSSPLITRMARDSLLYFIFVLAELLACTVIWARFPTYINIIMPWSAAIPSVLGSRLLLNMHEIGQGQNGTSIVFNSEYTGMTFVHSDPESRDEITTSDE